MVIKKPRSKSARPSAAPKRIKPKKPKRSYKAVIESLAQVWKIERLRDDDAYWRMGKAASTHLSPDALRVAVWNLCKGAGGRLFEHDYRMICYRSDLILTQEALLSERGMRTYCEPGFEAVHAASYRRRDGVRDGVMTVARASAGDHIKRIVCKYPEPVFKTPKVALVTFYRLQGRRDHLMVVNLHATLVRRVEGATEEMLHLLARLPEHDGPVIFAGDFNTFTPRYLAVVERALSRVGLELVEIPDDPRPPIGALDQVFVRGLNVSRIFVDTTIQNSDHFPLFVDVAVAESKSGAASTGKPRSVG